MARCFSMLRNNMCPFYYLSAYATAWEVQHHSPYEEVVEIITGFSLPCLSKRLSGVQTMSRMTKHNTNSC
jgi:hypothetical protein